MGCWWLDGRDYLGFDLIIRRPEGYTGATGCALVPATSFGRENDWVCL